jgi:glycosyltransferase involved in cell wall biosynthesis
MKVFFAPDYREGVPYQALLADALAGQDVAVTFPHGHRRVLPLWRGVKEWDGDLLHIHWPEKYFELRHDGLDFARKIRYPLDLRLTLRRFPLVLTAHDLRPHNRHGRLLVSNFQRTYDAARAIIVHSQKAGEMLRATYGASPEKLHVIPHGDLSVSMQALPPRASARAALGIPEQERVCLMFGTIEPYKGIEPVVDWWRSNSPAATLAVAGKPFSPEYGTAVRMRGRGATAKIRFDLTWQSPEALERWLAAADCVLFHYRAILTSGAACLARSLGIPILIPRRLDTVGLAEPNGLVFRFDQLDTDFREVLERALGTRPDYNAAADWREATAWARIAEQTARVYRTIA